MRFFGDEAPREGLGKTKRGDSSIVGARSNARNDDERGGKPLFNSYSSLPREVCSD